ncbi:BQ5605_C018g08761 [Microbotryum silenes-dioicae]|uniref:BQ5605_C018g08761 protein n=1 Tax=Microbotryum silenes-dioicae TaxID=796604 RepID=A0A2X0NUR2_9BASI|nr:BQ5605_C018g08761 [Microbotryum silenes-dioicae]
MTTMQPILALRHVYEPAASAPGSNRAQTPQAHVSIRDDLGPQTAVCTHCKARHWECERSKSTRHFSACCSQGKVRLPPPPQPNLEYRQLLEGSDSGQLLRPTTFVCIVQQRAVFHFARCSLRADTTGHSRTPCVSRVRSPLSSTCALIPAVNQRLAFAQTWLIDPAEATDSRLGPEGADMDPAPLYTSRPRSTHPQPSYVKHGNGDAYLRFRHHHGRSWSARPYSPARSIRLRCLSGSHYYFLQGKMASTPTFLLRVLLSWAAHRLTP